MKDNLTPEIGPAHLLSYRQETLAPLFRVIQARESCAIVGSSSMGKSRLLHFILRADVQEHYLDGAARTTLLVLVDSNRLAEVSEWGFYELLLTALTEACGQNPAALALRSQVNTLRDDAITSHNTILAWRHVELAIHVFCHELGLVLCFVLDEFDQVYQTISAQALRNLRALRDANRYQVCYLLMLRDHPARLRSLQECESFYELFSRSILGMGPYNEQDAEQVIQQLEARNGRTLSSAGRTHLLQLSGGHPGLMLALFATLPDNALTYDWDWLAWSEDQATLWEECRKLWNGLGDDERQSLLQLAQGGEVDDGVRLVLLLKKLIHTKSGADTFFSPLFAHFVVRQGTPARKPLALDERSGIVWRGDQAINSLTAHEFDLLTFLHRHVGQICTRDQILTHLYPDDTRNEPIIHEDKRVDTLIKRLREKIEPNSHRPRYLLTLRGKGYKLVDTPDPQT